MFKINKLAILICLVAVISNEFAIGQNTDTTTKKIGGFAKTYVETFAWYTVLRADSYDNE